MMEELEAAVIGDFITVEDIEVGILVRCPKRVWASLNKQHDLIWSGLTNYIILPLACISMD